MEATRTHVRMYIWPAGARSSGPIVSPDVKASKSESVGRGGRSSADSRYTVSAPSKACSVKGERVSNVGPVT